MFKAFIADRVWTGRSFQRVGAVTAKESDFHSHWSKHNWEADHAKNTQWIAGNKLREVKWRLPIQWFVSQEKNLVANAVSDR